MVGYCLGQETRRGACVPREGWEGAPRPQGGVGTGFISAQGGQLLHLDLTVLRGLEKTSIYLASPTAFYVKLFCRLEYFITLRSSSLWFAKHSYYTNPLVLKDLQLIHPLWNPCFQCRGRSLPCENLPTTCAVAKRTSERVVILSLAEICDWINDKTITDRYSYVE